MTRFIYKFLFEDLFSVLWGIYLGVELWDHMVVPFFGEPPSSLPQLLHHFTFPLAIYKHSNFSPFLHLLFCLFIIAILVGGHEVLSPYGFDLHFPKTNDVEHLFLYLLTICISLEKYLFKTFAPPLFFLSLCTACRICHSAGGCVI